MMSGDGFLANVPPPDARRRWKERRRVRLSSLVASRDAVKLRTLPTFATFPFPICENCPSHSSALLKLLSPFGSRAISLKSWRSLIELSPEDKTNYSEIISSHEFLMDSMSLPRSPSDLMLGRLESIFITDEYRMRLPRMCCHLVRSEPLGRTKWIKTLYSVEGILIDLSPAALIAFISVGFDSLAKGALDARRSTNDRGNYGRRGNINGKKKWEYLCPSFLRPGM